MIKKITGSKACYAIGWSPLYRYHRITASRILPELPGVIMFYMASGTVLKPLFTFATWRDGLRDGMRNLFDRKFTKCEPILSYAGNPDLHYTYTIVDSNKKDLRDVFYCILRQHRPQLNTLDGFTHTGRFSDISIYEIKTKNPTEKLKVPGFTC